MTRYQVFMSIFMIFELVLKEFSATLVFCLIKMKFSARQAKTALLLFYPDNFTCQGRLSGKETVNNQSLSSCSKLLLNTVICIKSFILYMYTLTTCL